MLATGQNGNRSWITLLACICQDLQPLPPMLICQGNFQDTWLDDFDPETEEAYFATSPTGWTVVAIVGPQARAHGPGRAGFLPRPAL